MRTHPLHEKNEQYLRQFRAIAWYADDATIYPDHAARRILRGLTYDQYQRSLPAFARDRTWVDPDVS